MKTALMILLLALPLAAQVPVRIKTVTIANLPAAADGNDQVYRVSDGQTPLDCTSAGSGSDMHLCWSNGSTWIAVTANMSTAARQVLATSPLAGGGDLTSDRTITCTTCATTTNGGALSGTSPVAISAAGAISIQNAAADGSTKGAASFNASDFDASSGNISIDYTNGQAASGSAKGLLSSTDWTTFNSKVGTARAVNTTSPVTGGGDLSADRTIACATCATTTNGGALSGTSPVTVSVAGAIGCATCLTANQSITLSGDVTGTGSTAITTVLANIPSGTVAAGSILQTAIAAPGTPASGKGSVYVDSTSKNLAVKDDAGTVKHGVQTKAAVSNSFATAIDDAGLVTVAQPSFTNLSGSATGAQLPNPSSSSLGGVQSAAAASNQWINSISTSGVPALSQPAFTNISGSVAAAQMPALTGDITTSAGAVATTLATVASAGTTGSSTAIPVVTINAKGLTTTITTAAVIAPAGTLSGATLASGVTASSLTSVGAQIKTVGSAPTCAFSTGGGTSPSCALETGSTDLAGTMTITTGTGSPGSTGTITLTFNATNGTNSPACIAGLTKGATDWSVSSTVRVTTQSTTAPVFSWASQSATAAVSLTASTNYKITYICFGK